MQENEAPPDPTVGPQTGDQDTPVEVLLAAMDGDLRRPASSRGEEIGERFKGSAHDCAF
jgi:hypothetical protein